MQDASMNNKLFSDQLRVHKLPGLRDDGVRMALVSSAEVQSSLIGGCPHVGLFSLTGSCRVPVKTSEVREVWPGGPGKGEWVGFTQNKKHQWSLV